MLVLLVSSLGLAWPVDAEAQRSRDRSVRSGRAVPRTSPPRVHRVYRPRVVYYPRFYYPRYSPWYYHPYYSSFGFGLGWYGSYWGPYGYPYAYPYHYPYYYRYDDTGSARLQITPRHAQVYVDGYFVGLVDEFDGTFQRLHVPLGEHEVQVYLDGYRTYSQKVLFTRGNTVKLEQALEPLAPGDPPEPKPAPDPSAAPARGEASRPRAIPRYGPEAPGEYGTVSLRVSPADAEVLIDGEPWDRPAGDDRFSIDLPEGPHRVEVRKEGFSPYTRTIEVRRGRTVTLNVSLSGGE
jgi:hypothetical protein